MNKSIKDVIEQEVDEMWERYTMWNCPEVTKKALIETLTSLVEKAKEEERARIEKIIDKCTDHDGMVIDGKNVAVIKRSDILESLSNTKT